jgi:hypothetical protein
MYSAALTVAGCYVPFTDIGSVVMKMLADTHGIKIDDSDKRLGRVKIGPQVLSFWSRLFQPPIDHRNPVNKRR